MDADLRSVASARRTVLAAWDAYRQFLGTDPKVVDEIVWAMSRAVQTESKRLGEIAAEETGYGNAEDKRIKNLFNAVSVADWLRNITTLGVLWRDEVTKIAAIGEPMGVVAALIPVTNPTSTIIYKVLSAVKSGNAIVCAPHPRGVRCGLETVRVMAEAAEQHGAPRGLIQCLDEVTVEGTAELMRHRRTSVVMATGGPAMVRAAYSSGKPTLAVGAGNVPVYVHASKARELDEVAEQIIMSKCFDYGTACLSEQAVMADRQIARALREEMKLKGAYFCSSAESKTLGELIFAGGRSIVPAYVGQSAQRLAELSGFDVPPRTRILVSEQSEVGWKTPLSAEKLNPILAWYEVKDAAEGIARSGDIVRFGGWGHSAVIHCDEAEVVAEFSRLPVGRVLVNTPAIVGGMGFSTDLEPSFMLGTGTWSGSITSDNVTALHLINIKRVAYESRPWRDIYDVYGD